MVVSNQNLYTVPVIAEGDAVPPDLLNVIQCRLRRVLRRYVNVTSGTLSRNCHDGQDCLNPFTATRENFKLYEEGTVKQITLTETFQMILMMSLI